MVAVFAVSTYAWAFIEPEAYKDYKAAESPWLTTRSTRLVTRAMRWCKKRAPSDAHREESDLQWTSSCFFHLVTPTQISIQVQAEGRICSHVKHIRALHDSYIGGPRWI